jgi:uncharacterized protein
MFRQMLRIKQLLNEDDLNVVMRRCSAGTLACIGDDGYPYSVPLSYVYHNGKIYFHSAKIGHKMDAIKANPKVSFSVIDEDTIVSAEYTTYFRSAVAFGKARIVEDDERISGFKALVEKYSGDQPEDDKAREIMGCNGALIIAIDVEHITGKEAIEHVQAKRKQ